MKSWLILSTLLVAGALTGCSGGGANSCGSGVTPIGGSASSATGGCGSSSGGVTSPTVTVAVTPAQVTAGTSGTATATVVDGNGAAVSGVVVQFTNDATIGHLTSAAALTDSSGKATVTITPASGTAAGADTLTATAVVNGSSYSGTAGYAVAVSPATFSSFTSDLGSEALASYSRTTLTLKLDNVSAATPVTLNISSDCVTAGKATITPTAVTSNTGTITLTYLDTGGCGALLNTDNILAAISGGSGATDSLNIALTSPAASSLAFNDAVPKTIYLKGSGLGESSTVSFKVVDRAGNPLPNQHAMLGLTTFTGGLTIDGGAVPVAKVSDGNGIITAQVNSGTVPTPVRIRAVLGDDFNAAGGTVSSALAVATGLPTEANFSLSQSIINMEGATADDVLSTINVIASDRSGNPVPDGTTISFWSEGGQIVAQSKTVAPVSGAASGVASASVPFVSADFRPVDGHVTVVAYALGEETFLDQNGNNVWDTGEPWQDLGDVDKDRLFDGVYDKTGGDAFVSLNGSTPGGTQTCVDQGAAGEVLALSSNTPRIPFVQGTCDGAWSSKVYVRKATEVIFSTSTANPVWPSNGGLDASAYSSSAYVCPTVSLQLGPQASSAVRLFDVFSNSTWTVTSLSGTITVVLNDANSIRFNPMPVGTTVSVASSDTTVMTVGSAVNGQPVPNTDTPGAISFTYSLVGGNTSGTATLNIKTAGAVTSHGQTLGQTVTSVPILVQYSPTAPAHLCQTGP